GSGAGVLAALVLTFTLQFSVYARTFAADSFLTLAVILAAIALDEACRREGPDARLGILAGAALALAFGIKGLVGIALPAGGVAAGVPVPPEPAGPPLEKGGWGAAGRRPPPPAPRPPPDPPAGGAGLRALYLGKRF